MQPTVTSRAVIVNNLINHKNISVEIVARQARVPEETIRDMLARDREVDKDSLIRIARIFRKHWTVFLLQDPIYEGIQSADLRQGPSRGEQLSFKTIDALDSAAEIIEVAQALDLDFRLNLPEAETESPRALARIYRSTSNISQVTQQEQRSSSRAYLLWVDYLQQLGIHVIKHRLDNGEIRGASIRRNDRAVILVNSNDTYNSQIFTLFHELCHIVRDSTGYCDWVEGHASEESSCNQFASHFLVPNEWLESMSTYQGLLENRNIEDEQVRTMARIFNVSSLVIYRRLLENNVIDRAAYQEVHDRITGDFPGVGGSGGNFYTTTIAQNSKLLIKQLFDAFYDQKIEYSSIAGSLNIKIDQVEELRRRVNLRG